MRSVVARLIMVGWLLLVWCLLWGGASPLVLVTGVAVAVGALVWADLPALELSAAPRPAALVRALGAFAVDLVVSSLRVAWAALRYGPRTRGGIVAVPLGSNSDVVMTVVAARISLTPDSIVIDIDRPSQVMWVYALPMHAADEADAVREKLRRTGAQLVHALGERSDGHRSDIRRSDEEPTR